MKKLLLIDLSGSFWRHWHATKDQELSAAFENTLGEVARLNSGYDYCAICTDSPPYRRKEKAPSYKANREAAPPQAVEQLRRVKARLEADGLCVYEAKGYEADDVIATIVELAKNEDPPLDITIASGDKDLLQLVSDSGFVRALSPQSGNTYDEKGVAEKLGVPPQLVADWLALVGDSSDGVAGVKGIGPKKAADLLQAFGDIHGVLEASIPELMEVVGKLGQAVADAHAGIHLALDLVKLETNAPIDFDAIFEKREPKPLGPKGAWDDAEFDEVLPPAKTPAPTADSQSPSTEEALRRGVAPAVENTGQSTALAVPPRIQTIAPRPVEWTMGLEPTRTGEAYTVAKYFNDSRLYPNLPNQNAIFAVILRGRSLGLDAATSCSMFHVVKGRPVMHAELILGLVMRSGKAEYFECIETTDEKATWVTKRVGGRGELSITWDMARAARAGLIGSSGRATPDSNWAKYPRTMLRWRAGTELAHAVYPEIVSGLVSPDEAEHLDAAE